MAGRFQLRRGTTAQNDAFIGAEGEVTYDTQAKGIRVHDGVTPGGTALFGVVEFKHPTPDNGYRWYRKYSDGWVEQGGPLTAGATETITYDVPLKYAVCPTINGSTTRQAASYDDEKHARSYSTTGFTTRNFFPAGGNGGSWEVKGMAA